MEAGPITVDGMKVGIITANLAGEEPSYPETPFYESEGYPNNADFDRNVRLGHKHGYYPKSGSGGGNEGYVSSGDDPEFTARVDRMIEAAKKEGITIGRGGGFRTRAQQERLYREKPGLAAPPGHSLHELGIARDLTYGPGGSAWAHKHAAEFGLRFPMSYEPWHVQPIEGRGLLKHRAPSAGTPLPKGSVRGSWFDDPHTASGKSAATTPGIALPTSSGLGKMHEITDAQGRKLLLPQIDVGPARWTGRGVDFSKPAAQQLGYDPTGKHFTVKEADVEHKIIGYTSKGIPIVGEEVPDEPVKTRELPSKGLPPLETLGRKAAGGTAGARSIAGELGETTTPPEGGLPSITYNPTGKGIEDTLRHEMGHAGAYVVREELKRAFPTAYSIRGGGFEELRQRTRDYEAAANTRAKTEALNWRNIIAGNMSKNFAEDNPTALSPAELVQMAHDANVLADQLAKEAMNPPMPKPRPE